MLCLQEKDAAREKLKYILEEAIFMTKDIFCEILFFFEV